MVELDNQLNLCDRVYHNFQTLESCLQVCRKWRHAIQTQKLYISLHIATCDETFNFNRLEKFENLFHLELDGVNTGTVSKIKHENLRSLAILDRDIDSIRTVKIDCPRLLRFAYAGSFHKFRFEQQNIKILQLERLKH